MNKKRLRNRGLWIAITALILRILTHYTVVPESEATVIMSFVEHGLDILILLGIINNPTNPENKTFNL